jgi:hypothetical protein
VAAQHWKLPANFSPPDAPVFARMTMRGAGPFANML